MTTTVYRRKYAKRQRGALIAYPAGGQDVYRLCQSVDSLERLVREIQRELPTDRQNDVERRLWGCLP